MEKIRIVIADDQTLLRDGLQTIINLEEDMEVVGVAENGEEAYSLVATCQPTLVLMDIRMPGANGLEATRMILDNYPDTMVVMLTTFAEEEYIVDSLAHGACGFLLKDMPGDKLIQAIRDAASGHLLMPNIVARKLAARISHLTAGSSRTISSPRMREQGISFTEREKHIILLMLQGKNNKEISRALFMSEGTVKNYVSIIYHKIGIKDRSKAVLFLKELFEES
ncbi:response regulator [Paenibacillus sedimenti]|uniref:Response regulator transcription factor n=1 Tax=Paenibacillus sedimenti TaxID=2770274 RepID=A0A926KUZ1_9BACL|nr:response regulator transcription factor [Paenibacillus sedimenti]MBD0382619.1 response regulator transcription factor [Paenibacillus sedimenti]